METMAELASGSSRRRFLSRLGWAGAAAPLTVSGAAAAGSPAEAHGAPAPSLTDAFVTGREYFVLRSGRALLVAQTDTSGYIPAFLYLVFDAQDNRQSGRKSRAFHFGNGEGFLRSALEVDLGGYTFTAQGHQTQTKWSDAGGIPAAEAVWWAGGLRVTERLFALEAPGLFVRHLELTSADLGGAEEVTLRLSLPAASSRVRDGWLELDDVQCRIALAAAGAATARPLPERAALELGPLTLEPGQTVQFDTLLLVQIAPGDGDTLPEPTAILAEAGERTRVAWRRASSVMTADRTVKDIFDKARFGLPAMVAANGVMNAGIFEYGSQWVRDTSNTLLGLVHAGQFEQAHNGFAHVLEHMVNADGSTMVEGAFESPDLEQFDQMGELLHALKAYRDWSGDDSLLREHRAKLVALIERPLRPEFRHPSGMVHNRREFWERTTVDGCELAYQTYVALGLRDAAALAGPLGAGDRADAWRAEATRILDAMLTHPSAALVEQGRLIKRRAVSGEWVRTIDFPGSAPDVPQKTERVHLAEPDATMALPIALGLVDPHSVLARKTLEYVERLWNARWFGGGHERYHSSGQCDQPGPWAFASCFILRALHDSEWFDRSRRTLEYLNSVQGGRTGAWFEEIPLARSQAPSAGVLGWTSGEISLFIVRHLLGVRFEGERLALRPALYPASPAVQADLRFRGGRLELEIPGPGRVRGARVNGKLMAADRDGTVRLPATFEGGSVCFEV